jgi:hypothetical protein
MTQYPDLFAALAAPFEAHEVKSRNAGGRQVHYITARTAMNRLDGVLGPENWWDTYAPAEHSVQCALSIRLPDGQVLTKCDAGGNAGMADEGDDDKSGYSDAFKRAAVKFLVGRYLYRDGVPDFRAAAPQAEADEPRDVQAPADHPAPPPVSRPEEPRQEPAGQRPQQRPGDGQGAHHGPPRTGKALFAWSKEQEQRYEVGLLKYLNGWAKLQDFPYRMTEWDAEQVRLAYGEACRKLQSVQGRSEAHDEALSNGTHA